MCCQAATAAGLDAGRLIGPEVPAAGRAAVRRRLDDFDQACRHDAVGTGPRRRLHAHALAGNREGDRVGAPSGARHAVAGEIERIDLELDDAGSAVWGRF